MKRVIAGLIVGLVIIVILLKRVDIRQLNEILLNVNVSLFVTGLFLKILVMWIKSYRWEITLRKATGQPIRRSFSASIIGFAGNIILPARLGELLRVSVIDKHNMVGRTLAFTTLGVTQLFDLVFLTGFFLLLSIWATSLYPNHRWEIVSLGLISLLILTSLIIFQKKIHSFAYFPNYIRPIIPKSIEEHLSKFVNLIVKGLNILTEAHAISYVILLTIIIWGVESFAVYLMLQAFNIHANLLMAGFMVVALNLSFAFPITPGNIGIVQAISVVLLGAFDVTQASALTYSIASQGITYIVIVSLGMIFFYFEKMNLNLLRHKTQENGFINPASILEKK